MRIVLACNLQQEAREDQAVLFSRNDVDSLLEALHERPYRIRPLEVSGPEDELIEKFLLAKPEPFFRLAAGVKGQPAKSCSR